MKKIYLLLLLIPTAIGIIPSKSNAQTSQLYFDHLDIQKGLPASGVNIIKEDPQGYMWFAPLIGLVRYDGYSFKVYNIGSSKRNISFTTEAVAIFIDKNNTMWVGLEGNGLCKYDRNTDTFQQFSYPDIGINTYFYIKTADNEGNLWGPYAVNDKSGVAKFNVKTKRFEVFGNWIKGSNYLNASEFSMVYKLADGKIWLTSSNGMYCYNGPGKPFKSYFTTTDTAKQMAINPIYEAPSEPGVLWMNTFHGNDENIRIARFAIKTNTLKVFKAGENPYSEKTDSVNNIYEDKKKQLWFATTQGLSKLDRSTGKFTNYIPQDTIKLDAKNQLSEFSETNNGSFWLSSPAGLVYFDPVSARFERYQQDNDNAETLSHNNIIDKIIDHTNVLWVGSMGVDRVNKLKSAFRVYKKINGKVNSYPGNECAINVLADGSCAVVNDKNIYKWQPGTNEFEKTYSTSTKNNFTGSVIQTKTGIIYASSINGLIAYNTHSGNKEQYRFNEHDTTSICDDLVTTIYQDHAGIIWVGSREKGICSFDPVTKKFTRYKYRVHREKINAINIGWLDDQGVSKIYEDHENNLWVGSIYGGLNVFNRRTNKFTSYLNKKNDGIELVNNILEDNRGRFWVSSYLNGLFEFDRKKGSIIRRINEQTGLLFNSILGLEEDNEGRIWVLTERGLSRVDPETFTLKNFKINDILPGFNVRGVSSVGNVFKMGDVYLNKFPDGKFAFTLASGIAVFNPRDLDDSPYEPIVHIIDIAFSNPRSADTAATRVLRYGRKTLELPYDQNRIILNYVGLQFDNPSENTYAYKLEGYDKQWVQAGKTRAVAYTNLAPAKYIFHVRAANSSGVWNNKGDSITIIIYPPWWFTWGAWVIYIALFLFAVYAFINYRSRKLRRENQLLEEKINLRTKQLSEANKELNEQQEEIVTQRDRLADSIADLRSTQTQLIQSEKMASLGELTAGIAHEIQNPLNFVNNFAEVSIELLDELKEEAKAGNNEDVIAIAGDLSQNLEKINHHGKRADFIVKGMLQHSRTSTGERQLTNLNILADEFLKLSYHGLRAKDKSFNSEMVTHLDSDPPKVNVVQQDIGRVFLNLFNNAFYAVNQKQKTAGAGYKPEVSVATYTENGQVVIKVKDNGVGIPDVIKGKIMQPFFTTKPTGEGTGLGLSLTYDMVVKGHGGSIKVNSVENEGSEFIITLPIS